MYIVSRESFIAVLKRTIESAPTIPSERAILFPITIITVVVITHNQAISAMGDKVIKIKNGIVDSVVINDNPVSVDEIDW